jgi:putative ATPase
LKTGKILEATIKEACQKTGAQYHEAADKILISGTWEQVAETQQIIYIRIEEGSGRGGSTSSSDYSEGISSKPGRATFDTSPPIAKYFKSWYDGELKDIEQKYQVKISWSKDYTKVHIKAKSNANYNDDVFNAACDHFAGMQRQIKQTVTNIPFNVSQGGRSYSKEQLRTALNAVPRYVSRLILDKSADGNRCTLWGTELSLHQANLWLREQLGVPVERPRSVSPKGPPKDALNHETSNNLKVVVYQGDITKENADIIVNACNKHLDHGGGVSHAISRAGGPSIQRESDDYVGRHGALKTGDVAVTGSGLLHCKHVVHAVGPRWGKHGKEGCMKLFQTVFMNVYKAARKHGAKSIAMPAISSGIYGVPKDVCAEAAFSFVEEIDQQLASDSTARPFEIRLVNIDGEIVKTFTQKFREWEFKGRKVQRRHSFSAVPEESKETSVAKKSADDMHKPPTLKAVLVDVRKPLQRPAKDGRSLDTTSSAVSTTASSNVKIITTGVFALQTRSDPSSGDQPSSTLLSKVKKTTGVSAAQYPSNPTSPSFTTKPTSNNSVGSTKRTSTTGNPSHHEGVSHTSQSSSQSKYDESASTPIVRYDQNGSTSHSGG